MECKIQTFCLRCTRQLDISLPLPSAIKYTIAQENHSRSRDDCQCNQSEEKSVLPHKITLLGKIFATMEALYNSFSYRSVTYCKNLNTYTILFLLSFSSIL
jgi:hypothetical protein